MDGFGRQFKNNPIKNLTKSKTKSNCKKTKTKNHQQENEFSINTVFSLYFKSSVQNIHAADTVEFSLHFLFRCDQNHNFSLTLKNMKLREQTLKNSRNQNKKIMKNSENESKNSFSQ